MGLLDAHGGHGALLAEVGGAYKSWRAAEAERKRAEADMEQAKRDEEFLRHAVEELSALDPQEGEEEQLAQDRQMMMNGEKLIDAMNDASKALDDGSGVERMLRDAMRALDGVAEKSDGLLDPALAALNEAADQVALALQELDRAASRVDLDPKHLEAVEERLFALRALARKHNVDVTALASLYAQLSEKLAAIEDGGQRLGKLKQAELQARATYSEAAAKLSQARTEAAVGLDQAVAKELDPLKLGQAVFTTRVSVLDDEHDWGDKGWDRVAFEVATNPGAPAGPLNKIASGGELSRFMLALKVVLAQSDPVPTLVFDEVASGIGGAVADAVGQRLGQ
ncbi:MAG: DNA repair protein RecN, partial [Arenibacter algicola]|nr:DNA repair protein RecN [Arenibacter algicola]